MKSSLLTPAAFAEADERALDRAVRRLPGFWTWDYQTDEAVNGRIAAVISPPWNPAQEAFHVTYSPDGFPASEADGERDPRTFGLESDLEERASGTYGDLEHLLRGVRAVVMGDSFDRSNPQPATARALPPRETAKGRPIARLKAGLSSADLQAVEYALAAWGYGGSCPLNDMGDGRLYASWDERMPAFLLWREDGAVHLTDNLTVNSTANVSGTFSSVGVAMQAVRCVVQGDWSSKHPEISRFFAADAKQEAA